MYNVEQKIIDALEGYHNFVPAGLRNKLIEIGKKVDFEEKGKVSWCAEDIIGRARECSKWYRVPRQKEAQEILEYMIHKHDATIGINWDVIDCYLPPKGSKPGENPNMP